MRKNSNKKTLIGNDSITIIVVVVAVLYLINIAFDIKASIKHFHEMAFNNSFYKNEYSISPMDLALVIESTVTSKTKPDTEKFEDYPFLSEPLNYRVKHIITPYAHHGEIELLLSENPLLAGTFQEDIKGTFVLLSNNKVNFEVKNLHYKTLLQEIHLKSILGTIHFGTKTQFQVRELNSHMNRLKFKASDLFAEINPKEQSFAFKVDKLFINSLPVEKIHGKSSWDKGKRTTFYSGRYKFIPTKVEIETKNGKSQGKLELPIRLVNDLLDPEINQEFADQERKVRGQNNPKATAVYLLSVEPKKLAKKHELLTSISRTQKIKKNEEYYTLIYDQEAQSGKNPAVENTWMKDIVGRYRAGDGKNILNDLRELKIKEPDSHQVYFALGWIHAQQNNPEKSVENYSISCSLGFDKACILAGDHFNFKNQDIDRAFIMYQLACDKKLGNGCLKAGIMAQEKESSIEAESLLRKSCDEFNDADGCYHLARHLHKITRPRKEVIKYLEKACTSIRPACQLAKTFKSGRSFPIPKKY